MCMFPSIKKKNIYIITQTLKYYFKKFQKTKIYNIGKCNANNRNLLDRNLKPPKKMKKTQFKKLEKPILEIQIQ